MEGSACREIPMPHCPRTREDHLGAVQSGQTRWIPTTGVRILHAALVNRLATTCVEACRIALNRQALLRAFTTS